MEIRFSGMRPRVEANRRTITNGEGEFRLRSLPPGKLRLIASHLEYGDSETFHLELEAGGNFDAPMLVLGENASLTVIVHPAAVPVAGRKVSVAWFEGSNPESILTDATGRAEFTGLSPGNYTVRLKAPKSDEPAREESAVLLRAQLDEQIVKLSPGSRIELVLGAPSEGAIRVTGRVTEGAEPVARTVVSLCPIRAYMRDLSAARTDEAGRFSLEIAESGQFRASVGSEFEDQIHFVVEIPDTREHSLNLALPTGSMRGLVIGPDARPAVNCPVSATAKVPRSGQPSWLSQRETLTDEAGRFEIKRLDAGAHILTAGGEQSWEAGNRNGVFGLRQIEDLIVPEGGSLEGIEIRLEQAAELSGTVLGPNGRPLGGASVSVTWPSGESVSIHSWWHSDAAGHFDIKGLPSGRVHVRAQRDGQQSEPREVQLTEGGETTIELVVDSP